MMLLSGATSPLDLSLAVRPDRLIANRAVKTAIERLVETAQVSGGSVAVHSQGAGNRPAEGHRAVERLVRDRTGTRENSETALHRYQRHQAQEFMCPPPRRFRSLPLSLSRARLFLGRQVSGDAAEDWKWRRRSDRDKAGVLLAEGKVLAAAKLGLPEAQEKLAAW